MVTALSCLVGAFAVIGAARAQGALVDPTRPATASDAGSAPQNGVVRVQAIVSRAKTRVAVVDGRLVRAGDRIAGVLIEEVTPEGVRYSQDGRHGFVRVQVPKPLPVRRTPVPQRDVP
jgi:hypothetical protein